MSDVTYSGKSGEPLQVEILDVPKPKARELLVKVKAASLCHSDLSIIDGAYGNSLFPLVPGHEAVSVVVALGDEAHGFGINEGDLVGAPLWHDMCLKCRECQLDRSELCAAVQCKGIHLQGYFCEYTVIDAASAVVVSPAFGVDTRLEGNNSRLSPIFCAGSTVWDAFDQAKLHIGETLVVVGAGGLGQLAIAYATAFGAKVIALDIQDPQLEACKESCPNLETINTTQFQGLELVQQLKNVNSGHLASCVIVVSGAKAAYDTALTLLEPYARLVVVGLPYENLEFPATAISMGRWT